MNECVEKILIKVFRVIGKIEKSIKNIIPYSNLEIRPSTVFIKNMGRKDLVGVEIGVEHGYNTRVMLSVLPIKKIFLVDPCNLSMAKKILAPFGHKTVFINKKSKFALDDIPDNLDFVYIDGDHSYDAVKNDISLYYKKIRKGGVLCGHDFSADYLGVCKAVMKFAQSNGLTMHGANRDWWVIKK